MTFNRILIASRDSRLLNQLDERLRAIYVVEMALTSREALSKLQSKWFAAMLVDRTLSGPGLVELARRLSPGMQVVSINPDDVDRVDELVHYLQIIGQSSEVAAACGVG
jgi:DNA-binding response OmpR family regulator